MESNLEDADMFHTNKETKIENHLSVRKEEIYLNKSYKSKQGKINLRVDIHPGGGQRASVF